MSISISETMKELRDRMDLLAFTASPDTSWESLYKQFRRELEGDKPKYALGAVTVTLSEAEQEALQDFLPRVQVANVCVAGSALHSALLKVSPKSLPWDLRTDL